VHGEDHLHDRPEEPVAMSRNGYVRSRTGQLHYRSDGTGPTALLLAPSPRSSLYYAPFLSRLDGHRAVAVDTPGFGLSSALPDEWTMEAIADLIADGIRDSDWGIVDVIGIHTGNKIGTALASRHPELVRSLSIVGMSHSLVLDKEAQAAAFSAYSPSPESVANAEAGASAERWRKTLDDVVGAASRGKDLAVDGGGDRLRGVVDYVSDLLDGADCYEAMYRANYAYDWDGALRRLTVPTLVLELLTPQESDLAGQAASIAAAVDGSTVAEANGSDRRLLSYEPHLLADPILAFLASVPPRERNQA
jgi:pimeloyl-ACP methyl ester carboxylesterase